MFCSLVNPGLIKRDMTKLGAGREVGVIWRDERVALWRHNQPTPEGYEPSQRLVMDATVIRGLLVPAFTRLTGPANWWTPAPLHRFHRRFGIRELPEPVLAHDTTGAPPTSAAY